MKKTLYYLEKILDDVSSKKTNFLIWFLAFLATIALRVYIEKFIASPSLQMSEVIIEYLHNFLFFLILFLIIWLICSQILKENPLKLANIMQWGFWIILLPPLLDIVKTGGEVYWSFYVLNDINGVLVQFLTFFGDAPSGIVYYGTKITFTLAILFVFFLIFIKSKSFWKAIGGGFLTYLAIFFMGNFPNIFVFAYNAFGKIKPVTEIKIYEIIQFFGAPSKIFGLEYQSLKYAFAYNLDLIYLLFLSILVPMIFFISDRQKFWAVFHNMRWPQIVYHGGLFLIGMGLGLLSYPENYSLNIFSVAAVLALLNSTNLAWMASVVVNDIYDYNIDAISSPWRPLQQKIFTTSEYKNFGIIVFILSLLGGLIVGVKFMALLLVYQILAYFYSADPYRLKKLPVLATFLSTVTALVILFMGFTLVSGDQNIQGLSGKIVVLLLLSFTLSLPIKDFKDIAGDKRYQIWTIPVLLGEDRARLLVAIGVFISFIASVFFLNELSLFWWAIAFSSGIFLVIVNKKIKTTNLFWWVLSLETAYILILIRLVFF
jgi:4-hydroxybenzoate polyprenyltransferase